MVITRIMMPWGFLCGALVACCGPTHVHVQSPIARYDHNRSRVLCIVNSDEPAPCAPASAVAGVTPPAEAPKIRFGAESYAPQSVAPYHVQYVQGDKPQDSLPPAQLVPIYTGVALPLSSAPIPGCAMCVSDRADLNDYLASGPSALAGVDAPDTQGDLKSTASATSAVLDRLSRKDVTKLDHKQLKQLFSEVDVEWADQIFDSRYPPAGLADVLAFGYKSFWFVLYRFPGTTGFTRLVVVPTGLAQDPVSKRPSSEPLPREKTVKTGE